tara:strand:- start:1 stop:399 length:399 start_codon:yes stop_codon:yes gene_type:complete
VEEADKLIKELSMISHPEGGYYCQTFKSEFLSQIYYLLRKNEKSEWHRLKKDEMLHFYKGDPLKIYTERKGDLKNYLLGEESLYNIVIKKGTWFGMKTIGNYSLIGCTVSPPFEFSDLEIYSKKNSSVLPTI